MRFFNSEICKVSDDFGDNLRAIRRQQKMSQKELAEAIGVDRRTIIRYENGETEFVRKDSIKKLSETLGYDIKTGTINDTGLMRRNLREIEQQNLQNKVLNLECKIDDMKDILKRKDELIAYLQRENKKLRS